MGDDGNEWHLRLIRPGVERLLGPSRASACSTSPAATGSTRGGWSSWAPRTSRRPTSRSRCWSTRVAAAQGPARASSTDAATSPTARRCSRSAWERSSGRLQHGPDGRHRDRPAGGVPRRSWRRTAVSSSRSRTPASTGSRRGSRQRPSTRPESSSPVTVSSCPATSRRRAARAWRSTGSPPTSSISTGRSRSALALLRGRPGARRDRGARLPGGRESGRPRLEDDSRAPPFLVARLRR